MKLTNFHTFWLIVLFYCIVPAAGAAPLPPTDDNIHINADRMNQNTSDNTYSAEGNVVVSWQGLTMTANRVHYTAASHLLAASGAVVLTRETMVLKGSTLLLNMESGRADMDSTELTIPVSNITITSQQLIRENENQYSATMTDVTACDLPDPSWNFTADRLKVNLQGYATGRNVIFYVKQVPVLYIPWFAFPVVTEKRSGLLFPRFGYSNTNGAKLDIPLYLVISPSQDLQLDLDMMSRRGVGTGLDYRYIRVRGSEGHINLYPIYDQIEQRWRGQLAQEHKEVFSKDANIRMTVNLMTDRTFLSDLGEKNGDYNRQSSDTIINGLKSGQNYAVASHLRYINDLYAADNRLTVQTLPSLNLSGVRDVPLPLPLYFDVDLSAENLSREAAPSGQRALLFPRVTLLPLRNGFVQSSFYAGAHARGYTTEWGENGGTGSHANDGDLIPEAGARISTSFFRIYTPDYTQLKKIRHEIIPEVRYIYVPPQDQQRLPLYDTNDRLIHQNMLSLSLTNLINGKFVLGETSEYRDISRIKLEARYSIAGERRDLLTLVDTQHPWSDLILESDTWLSKQFRLTFDSRYDLYEKILSTAMAGAEYDDTFGNTLGVGYQMANAINEYIEGKVTTKMIKPLNLSYITRYSFDRSDFLESVYSAEYKQKCWSITLAAHQRPGNQTYGISFNLGGL